MTQAVTFHFTSPQFIFESGSITFSKGARLSTSPDNNVAEIAKGVVDDVLRVETSSGVRVPRALLSIIQPATEATWEITANEAGELKMLARPGLYSVMAAIGEHSRGGASATFEVAPEEQGERLIVLQAN